METENKLLEDFECALGYQNKHILQKPVLLECSHAACFRCVQDFKDNTGLKHVCCLKCNIESSLEADYIVSDRINHYMNVSSKNILDSLIRQHNDLSWKLNSKFR